MSRMGVIDRYWNVAEDIRQTYQLTDTLRVDLNNLVRSYLRQKNISQNNTLVARLINLVQYAAWLEQHRIETN